ncbi:MAG: restriction endonuclease subunit S [Bacteroidales bacterium]|nr:restriction endonuclease subunit S [Bacteroidales bacterium]
MEVKTKPTHKRYPKYKDTGIKWLGKIPEHWELSKLGRCLKPISIKNNPEMPLLSITREQGVIKRDTENKDVNHNYIPDDLSNYKRLLKGQFGMNKMKAWQGSYGISDFDGIVSPAYYVFDLIGIEPRFFHLAIRSKIFVSYFGQSSDGVRIGQWDLSKSRMKEIPFMIPPKPEQTRIANFLDRKSAQIDKAISQKERLIELLKERRQIIIQNTVTRGLDPNVKLKDSGVEWIGMIPEHWEVKRLKYLTKINKKTLSENTNPNYEFEYVDIGNVTLYDGIISTESYSFRYAPLRARRIADEGDTIISTVRTYLKAIDYIDHNKCKYIFSTGFAILKPESHIYTKYLAYFVRSESFTKQVIVNSKGMSYPAINSFSLGNLCLAHPSYNEQTKIVKHIEKQLNNIDKVINQTQQQIQKLKEYKTVLIDNAVTGKIKVNEKSTAYG